MLANNYFIVNINSLGNKRDLLKKATGAFERNLRQGKILRFDIKFSYISL